MKIGPMLLVAIAKICFASVPTVSLSLHDPVSLFDTIHMNVAIVSASRSIVKYEWACDGRISTAGIEGTAQSKCIAGDPGNQPIIVYVTDDSGQTGSATQSVTILSDNPTVTLSAHDPVSLHDTIRLTATGSDIFGKIVKYEWACDGRISTAGIEGTAQSKCIAGDPGNQLITVHVTDDDGQTGSASQTVLVSSTASISLKKNARSKIWTVIRSINGKFVWAGYLEEGNTPQLQKGIHLVKQGEEDVKTSIPYK